MSDRWIPTREINRMENARNQRSVTGWTIVGSSYRNGRKIPGYTHLDLSGGGWLYYPEDVAIGPALDDADAQGFDTSEARRKLAETGKDRNL